KKETSEITALLNAGFQRGLKVYRCSTEGKRELEMLEAFCPVLLSGIDKQIPDTILDRAITIKMKRRYNEAIEPYRPRDNEQEGLELKARLEQWAKVEMYRAREMRPDMPRSITDRNADKWEPLFIVADLVPGVPDVPEFQGWLTWGNKAREAAATSLAEYR